jgi:hypothetical protein
VYSAHRSIQILNGFPQFVEILSQEEYDSLLNQIANRLADQFKVGLHLGASFAFDYCTKNIKAMVNMEVVNQGFDRNTVLRALNFSSTEKGN